MIPKTIHYCWVGPNKKPEEVLTCIKSWKTLNSDFEIKEWNESNFDVNLFPFTQKMYKEKRWAFVSDYMRLYTLEKYGGFYLDTDMLLLQSLSPLSDNSCVLGEENKGVISAGMIGAEAHHPFIRSCKEFYDKNPDTLITIPRVLTSIFNETAQRDKITVYPPRAFYPFDSDNIKEWHGQNLGNDVYGVHLWNYSWGNPINKFFKKVGIYSFGKKLTESLGIKSVLKKLLGFI